MIIEIIIVIVIALFCVLTKRDIHILFLLALLLPIHDIIKFFLFSGGGSLFALWKEIAIIVYAIRIFNRKRNIRILFSYVMLFILTIPYTVLGYVKGYTYAADLRTLVLPGLLVISLINTTISYADVKKIGLCLCLSFSIINITGVIDFVSPEMRYYFRSIWGYNYIYGDDGNIYYENSSMKILGVERVAGLSAGPNSLGVNNSFFLYYLFMLFMVWGNSLYKNKNLILFVTASLLSIFCLVFSFSRAGMAILLISIAVYLFVQKKNVRYLIASFMAFILLVSFVVYFFPIVYTVFEKTFSGNEASSAARGNMVSNSFLFLIEHPYGHGLGSTYHTSNFTAFYFAESSFINVGIQIGVWGLLILLGLFWQVLNQMKRNRNNILAEFGCSFIVAMFVASWVSVNTFQNPFVYLSWMFLGLSCAKNKTLSECRNNYQLLLQHSMQKRK